MTINFLIFFWKIANIYL